MEFNTFLWNNYKESASGSKKIDLFKNIYSTTKKNENLKFLTELLNVFSITNDWEKEGLTYIFENAIELFEGLKTLESYDNEDDTQRELLLYIWSLSTIETEDSENPDYFYALDDISEISLALFMFNPDWFFPYFFLRQYHIIEKISDEFGIFLPPIPSKRNHTERFLHYLELCKSFKTFRENNNISSIEFPAFLYDFAINTIELDSINNKLKLPQKAYFIGAGKKNSSIDYSKDFDYIDKAKQDTIYNWQGNENAQPGDIIVMYCLSPRSYIHSIWRCLTPGSADPFFYFYNNNWIGKPVHIPQISLNEIKNDKILAEMPLVRANMQGINGRSIEKRYYDRILEIINKKDNNILKIPKLEDIYINNHDLKNEKDVERFLLEPLLLKLGWNKNDWKRQLKIKMGKGQRNYPDYVINATEGEGNESGEIVWEAKYSIKNNKQLESDFNQAKSYAIRLKCKSFGLISKEGIWLSEDDFIFKKRKHWSWNKLKEREEFNKIFDILGNHK